MTPTTMLRPILIAAGFMAVSATTHAVPVAMDVALDGTVSYTAGARDAWLKSAESGFVMLGENGTPKEEDVAALFGGTEDDWQKEGELNNTLGVSNDLFSITLGSGTWGGKDVTATWNIDPSFWLLYGTAVITMHVGGGNEPTQPSWFFWEVTPNETTGSFKYFAPAKKDGGANGGGLSNLFLWGTGEPPSVPDSGTTAILMGLGLVALSLFRRKAA